MSAVEDGVDLLGGFAGDEGGEEVAVAQDEHGFGHEAEVGFFGAEGGGEEDDDIDGPVVECLEVDAVGGDAEADGWDGDLGDAHMGHGDAVADAGAHDGLALEDGAAEGVAV